MVAQQENHINFNPFLANVPILYSLQTLARNGLKVWVWFALNLFVREILLYCSIFLYNRVRPCKPNESRVFYSLCQRNMQKFSIKPQWVKLVLHTNAKKMKFSIKICSVNVTESAGNCLYLFRVNNQGTEMTSWR